MSLDHPCFSSSSETMCLAFLAAVMASGRLPGRELGACSVVQRNVAFGGVDGRKGTY